MTNKRHEQCALKKEKRKLGTAAHTSIIPSYCRQRSGGLWFKASPGKKVVRPYLNQ
jgi:hypothetical protein